MRKKAKNFNQKIKTGSDYIHNMFNGSDFYLVSSDFYQYLSAQEKVDENYHNVKEWRMKILESLCRIGYFSNDRYIRNYADLIQHIVPIE